MSPDPTPKRISRARDTVATRLPKSMIARVDALAAKRGVLRGQWIRLAIERVVHAEEAKGDGGAK